MIQATCCVAAVSVGIVGIDRLAIVCILVVVVVRGDVVVDGVDGVVVSFPFLFVLVMCSLLALSVSLIFLVVLTCRLVSLIE